MIEVLPFLLGVVIYLGIGGFLVYLALRFVRAAEKLAHSAEQIANKP
jgi:threonine/homoserine/homoserine lactone efflux protein|tara:strand:+ start:722 stop:862 length:141 start_codon:yes stop_codon:yes gene_type:complete